MKISEVNFSDLSQLSYKMFLYEEHPEQEKLVGKRYLLIEFSGRHGIGSEGNNDSLFMETIIKTALNVWYVYGLVLDLRKLSYEWGDTMGNALVAGKEMMGNKFPTSVVVSELCRPALESLSPFYRGDYRSGEQQQWLFDNVDSALGYVKVQAGMLQSEAEQKREKKSFLA
jgi:hypothetical protein